MVTRVKCQVFYNKMYAVNGRGVYSSHHVYVSITKLTIPVATACYTHSPHQHYIFTSGPSF